MRKRSSSSSEYEGPDSVPLSAAAGGADTATTVSPSAPTSALWTPNTASLGVTPASSIPRRGSLARLNELAPLSPLPVFNSGRPPELLKEPGLIGLSPSEPRSVTEGPTVRRGVSGLRLDAVAEPEGGDPAACDASGASSASHRLRYSRFGSDTERSTAPSQASDSFERLEPHSQYSEPNIFRT